jgi:hypothetical protein
MQGRVIVLVVVKHLAALLLLLLKLAIRVDLDGQQATIKFINTNLRKAGDWDFVVIVDQLYVAYIKEKLWASR